MSYRKIFSVINEHTASTVSARYPISLAAAGKAELVLYAAHDEGSNETILRHTDRHLDHLFTVALELDIPVTRITEVGNINNLLPKRVQVEKADLVFYPLSPYERYGANLQRHTVHHLLRTIGSDLSIMRVVNMAKPHPRHILMPLGKIVSDREHRLMFITELAKSFHSQVTLFHLSAERDAKGMPNDITQFRKQLQQQDVKVLERSGKGHIGKSITVEAITRHNDLIVLGASERGVLWRMFLGNPAGDVMHQPPCNTILFRAAN
ncbi:MAG TPA: universal stress protein [Desulfuromonadaceae bacterium]|jgi:nucleotide-binding universal stress UspA family protein